MADSLKYKAASGKLLYNATSGKLVYGCSSSGTCVNCAGGTVHGSYQLTANGGWTNNSCGNCTGFNGTSYTATFDFDCQWSISPTASCGVTIKLGFIDDGAGGLTIRVTWNNGIGSTVTFEFHQVGSTNCDGPWTVTNASNSSFGAPDCSNASGSTMTVVGL